jgi:hypothetical protein
MNGYKISQMTITRYEGGDLHALLKQLLTAKSTGRLTLNVSQGGIGSLEWSEPNYVVAMEREFRNPYETQT